MFQRIVRVVETGEPLRFEQRHDGLGRWLDVAVFPQGGDRFAVLFDDITDRKLGERARSDEFSVQMTVLSAVNRILQSALSAPSHQKLGEECLAVAEQITGSAFGFIGLIQPDGTLGDVAISDPGWGACETSDPGGHGRLPSAFPVQGIYGVALQTGEAYVSNDPGSDPHRAGAPEGHPPITSFLGVPLIRQGEVSGMIAVANRPGGYGEREKLLLESLAPAIETALERRRDAEEIARNAHLVEAHLSNSPLAVIEFDPDFRVIRWSPEAQRMFGWGAEEVIGRHMSGLRWVYEEDAELVKAEASGFADGTRPRSLNVNRNYRKDGSIIWCEWYSSAVYDEAGRLSSVLSLVLDVTERKRAESDLRESLDHVSRLAEREEGLKKVAQAASASLKPAELAEEIAHTVAGIFRAKHVWLRLVSEDGSQLEPSGAYDPEGQLQEAGPMPIAAPTETAAVFRSGEPRMSGDIGETVSEATRRNAALTGVRAFILLPITIGDERVGVFYAGWPEPREFTEEDVSFVEAVVAQFSVGLQNARLYQVEHGIAQTLQETLVVMPSAVPGIRFSRAYRSATYHAGWVGGDFIDVFEVAPGLVAISLGDVSGKGIEAAVTTSLVRTTLRVHAIDGLSPAESMAKANVVIGRFIDPDAFVTLWFGLLRTDTGLLRYVNAGHPPGLVLGGQEAVRELQWGPPFVGVFPDAKYHEYEAVLDRGERLVLYSDGTFEARSPRGEMLGEERLREILARQRDADIEALPREIMNAVVGFSNGVLRDDAAVLAVELDTP